MDRDQLKRWLDDGLSLERFATIVDRDPSTVGYWCRRYGLVPNGRAKPKARGKPDRTELERLIGRRKRLLVDEAGGGGALCSYDRCVAALQFHHVDPDTKAFGIAYRGATRSLAAARAEAAKCVLVCSNCHAEVEVGVASLPSQSDAMGALSMPVDRPGPG